MGMLYLPRKLSIKHARWRERLQRVGIGPTLGPKHATERFRIGVAPTSRPWRLNRLNFSGSSGGGLLLAGHNANVTIILVSAIRRSIASLLGIFSQRSKFLNMVLLRRPGNSRQAASHKFGVLSSTAWLGLAFQHLIIGSVGPARVQSAAYPRYLAATAFLFATSSGVASGGRSQGAIRESACCRGESRAFGPI